MGNKSSVNVINCQPQNDPTGASSCTTRSTWSTPSLCALGHLCTHGQAGECGCEMGEHLK